MARRRHSGAEHPRGVAARPEFYHLRSVIAAPYLVPRSSSRARGRASCFRSAFCVPSGMEVLERLDQLGDGGEDRAVVRGEHRHRHLAASV